ncbi:MAG: ABC transporter ATP-binding protein, partial [Saprospiraceae bacterium]|nr:ABC transporter ATP-binding protein [Saprospiraceae bacterium]
MSKLLEIKDLVIDFQSGHGVTRAVDGISLYLDKGETLGIVGESGSGKSVTALSVMRLLPTPAAKIVRGEIWYGAGAPPTNLLTLPDTAMQRVRGADIAMIFQEPMTSLNPVFRCGRQVTEALQLHRK